MSPPEILYFAVAAVGIFALGLACGLALPRGSKPVIRYKDRATGRFVKGSGPL